MKWQVFKRHLERNGCSLLREGGKHSVYWNPLNRKVSTVPRHREMASPLSAKSVGIWTSHNLNVPDAIVSRSINMSCGSPAIKPIQTKAAAVLPQSKGERPNAPTVANTSGRSRNTRRLQSPAQPESRTIRRCLFCVRRVSGTGLREKHPPTCP